MEKFNNKACKMYIKSIATLHEHLSSVNIGDPVLIRKTNSMKQNPSLVDEGCSPDQKILCNLWDLKVHYHVYNSLPQHPILIPQPCRSKGWWRGWGAFLLNLSVSVSIRLIVATMFTMQNKTIS
jgi:hypothetical protein